MTTIAQQVRELQDMTPAQLAKRYEQLHGEPPRIKNKAYLQRRVAWRIQELAFGGLSDRAKSRLDELISQIDLQLGDAVPRRPRTRRKDASAPLVGTTLTRIYQGQEIRVEIREDGFEWEGTLYRSLSAVAKAITGSHWSGVLFFGLKKRSKSR